MKFRHDITYQSAPIFGVYNLEMYFYSIIPLPDKIGGVRIQIQTPTLSHFREARKMMVAAYKEKYEV